MMVRTRLWLVCAAPGNLVLYRRPVFLRAGHPRDLPRSGVYRATRPPALAGVDRQPDRAGRQPLREAARGRCQAPYCPGFPRTGRGRAAPLTELA